MKAITSRKLLKDEKKIPFYYQLKEDLKRRITENEFAVGSRMLSEHELMIEYDVSRLTVVRAISELTKEGLLYRQQGKGTFVAEPALPEITSQEIVGLIMPVTGHLYGTLASGIIKELTEHEYFCLMVDPLSAQNEKQKHGYERIQTLIKKSPSVLVIEGIWWFPFELLDQYQGRIIFVDHCNTEKNFTGASILSDYFEGGRIVTEHFLHVGYSKILYHCSDLAPKEKGQRDLIAGARQAFRDRNLPEENFQIYVNQNDDVDLDETLDKLEKPSAVFCQLDSYAKRIYQSAHRLGLRIPQDISVIGYFNTPWCEVYEPNLSSVSIREEDIASQVVEAILTGCDRKVLMKPKLVLRGSTINK